MALGLIPIDDQIAAMASRWPEMRLIGTTDRGALWEGVLRPQKQRYTVRIAYSVPHALEAFTISAIQPRVQVLDPLLELHEEFEEGPLPHVYWHSADLELPFLCLFDPYNGEWSPGDFLAETTVPWTARYLYFYEGWLLTGRWLGGGRHPTPEEGGESGASGKTIAAV
jgi:hypothetical protein